MYYCYVFIIKLARVQNLPGAPLGGLDEVIFRIKLRIYILDSIEYKFKFYGI